jgi:hypothetical protein
MVVGQRHVQHRSRAAWRPGPHRMRQQRASRLIYLDKDVALVGRLFMRPASAPRASAGWRPRRAAWRDGWGAAGSIPPDAATASRNRDGSARHMAARSPRRHAWPSTHLHASHTPVSHGSNASESARIARPSAWRGHPGAVGAQRRAPSSRAHLILWQTAARVTANTQRCLSATSPVGAAPMRAGAATRPDLLVCLLCSWLAAAARFSPSCWDQECADSSCASSPSR